MKLADFLKIHLDTNGKGYSTAPNSMNELEIRFKTHSKNKISGTDFKNVIQKLRSSNYVSPNELGEVVLKIINVSDNMVTKSVRTEIRGVSNIQKYCKTNSIHDVDKVLYMTKENAEDSTGRELKPINIDKYELRCTYQTETILGVENTLVEHLHTHWDNTKKIFRYMNRISFILENIPLKIELSVVKSNQDPDEKISTSGVFSELETYEIEIELLGVGDEHTGKHINKAMMVVLAGLQQTNYPISIKDKSNILDDYMKLIHECKSYKQSSSKNFIGPASVTLQHENLNAMEKLNILTNYTVTDKADGSRKLLYIAPNKKMYMLDTNLNVQFTGCTVLDDSLTDTIIDGEHILHNKMKVFINTFAAFDIYYLKGKSLRSNMFTLGESNRLESLKEVIRLLNNSGVVSVSGGKAPLRIVCKEFLIADDKHTIFQLCADMFEKKYEYETDGCIFTPQNEEVAGAGGPIKKTQWSSFKWKPAAFNTVDFLVSTKKDVNGKDLIGNRLGGNSAVTGISIIKYKTLHLMVGYDKNMHDLPCKRILDNNYRKGGRNYAAARFYPTEPEDLTAHICEIDLLPAFSDRDGYESLIMKTAEHDTFEDNMIVEFMYIKGKWSPLRVRYDKTEAYRKGGSTFGNDYNVANSIWYTIHHPITEGMLSGTQSVSESSDMYYTINNNTATVELRNFHNYVKRSIIKMVTTKPGKILLDLAVGKAGDLHKWIDAKVSFVLGIDIAGDNINNKANGACARYVNMRQQKRNARMPDVIFLKGDTSKNIKASRAFDQEKDKKIADGVFGNISREEANSIGDGLGLVWGRGKKGFDIVSCQFALHYYFKDKELCGEFLKNVAECTKIGGHFIGTCFDGELIYNALRDKDKLTVVIDGNKVWEVEKAYGDKEFKDDVSSLGLDINVYQPSFAKTFKEYLVHFGFLEKLMIKFGFKKVAIEKFQKFYDETNIKHRMSDKVKMISDFNKYFVFEKVMEVDSNINKFIFEGDDVEQPMFVKYKKIILEKKV
jgi:ubiquinone/menaquinone biosynthesis C-methylase UbiE